MSHIQLTAKHRPQSFAQVAGQEEIRAMLSRAAAQDRIATAYLFSGTRGVGKTTLARIFAKAINCVQAPTSEPCNQCHHCRQITIGSAVDVAEIDGASNRGIEQARRLKEDVGYAPLECRYKVIIIDEAHMLTKEAFNALLKTLEEPPPRVTFIMATTEPHKFPATIISRSQHYIFKMLSQAQLQDHLQHILELEQRDYEPAATALLARRAAGSVRDGMSLLEQVLTISEQGLRLEDVRDILGLAGAELFQRLVQAIQDQDCLEVHDVVSELLRHGLDIGFFIRELGGLWRDLFLLRQAGEKALPLLGLPEAEGQAWLATAGQLSPTYIHAAWQITLEAQRKVLSSLEPAQSLEMLLLNLTYLPQLLPLDDMAQSATPRSSQQSAAPAGPSPSVGPTQSQPGAMQAPPRQAPPMQAPPRQEPARQEPARQEPARQAPSAPRGNAGNAPPAGYPASSPPPRQADQAHEPAAAHGVPSADTQSAALQSATWDDFLTHYDQLCRQDQACLPGLRQVRCDRDEQGLALYCQSQVQYNGLREPHKWRVLEKLVQDFFGQATSVRLIPPKQAPLPSASATAQDPPERHPLVSEFVQHFKAKVVSG